MSEDKTVPRWQIILAFLAIYLIWGSTYLFITLGVKEIPPFIFAGSRFIGAGLLILIYLVLKGRKISFSKKQLLNSTIIGFLFLTLGNGGVSWALQHVDSGITALLISTQPLIILLLMWILEGQRIKPASIIGILLGIIGIYLLIDDVHLTDNGKVAIGLIVIFICLLSWAVASIFLKKLDMPSSILQSTMLQMITGGSMLFLVGLLSGEDASKFSTISEQALGSLFYLIIFGSIIGFGSFNFLLQHVSPEKVSTNTYVNPVVAVILGVLFLNEEFTSTKVIASIILISGVYFINQSRTSTKDMNRLKRQLSFRR